MPDVRHFQGQGHQAALLGAALTRKAAAAVSVGKYCYVASARRRARRLGAHGGGEGRGISCYQAHSMLNFSVLTI